VRWWPVFFARMRELLRDGSAAALQTITIAEERFEELPASPRLIQHYIFPGGMLPSPERFRAAAEAVGLAVAEPRSSAATTLGRSTPGLLVSTRCCLRYARSARRALHTQWRYYLAYCRTGFDHGSIDVIASATGGLGTRRGKSSIARPKGGAHVIRQRWRRLRHQRGGVLRHRLRLAVHGDVAHLQALPRRLLADQPKLGVAAGFYLLYVVGILALAVIPGLQEVRWSAPCGAARCRFPRVSTYDLTNLSTIRELAVAVS